MRDDAIPLTEWKPGQMVVSRNSLYQSEGEITLTVPLEIADMICGMLGGSPVLKILADQRQFKTSDLFDCLIAELNKVFPGGSLYRRYGKDLMKAGPDRPPYMKKAA